MTELELERTTGERFAAQVGPNFAARSQASPLAYRGETFLGLPVAAQLSRPLPSTVVPAQ